jgi:hypothetical protein
MSIKLTQLTKKPQLIKITVEDAAIVEKYGDAVEFWIYDRQPIEQFIKMATLQPDNVADVINIVNSLILDEAGEPVIKDGNTIPPDLMMAVVNQVVERLGK